MKTDLLKDIRNIRDQIGAECGYDLARLGVLVRQEERTTGKRLVRAVRLAKPKARRPRRPIAASVA
jgi:hypothetical protein